MNADSVCIPDSDLDDVGEQLLLDDSSHVPGPGVLRWVASSWQTTPITFFSVGVSLPVDSVHIARPSPSS